MSTDIISRKKQTGRNKKYIWLVGLVNISAKGEELLTYNVYLYLVKVL